MDNASKALIIAGGILISVVVIGLATYMFASARGVVGSSAAKLEASEIASFNRFYEAYGSNIKGVDAVNIIHKIADNNDSYDHNTNTSSLTRIECNAPANLGNNPENDFKEYLANYTLRLAYDSSGLVNRVTITKK